MEKEEARNPSTLHVSLGPQLCLPAPGHQAPQGSNCICSHLKNMFHIEGIYIKLWPNQARPGTYRRVVMADVPAL